MYTLYIIHIQVSRIIDTSIDCIHYNHNNNILNLDLTYYIQ